MNGNLTIVNPPAASDNSLRLSKIILDEKYSKHWNSSHYKDFVCLTRNGELVNNNLFRVGGLGHPDLVNDQYFMILKYVESCYRDEITKDRNEKRHLKGIWCIFDKNGIEKKEFSDTTIYTPHLIKGSIIYSLNQFYYNIETGQCYGHSYTSMQSNEFLFINCLVDKENCVIKINKKDGQSEIFK